jgi:DNA polymerase-3 subunit gamma/tau
VERESLRSPAQRETLQVALAAVLGEPVRLVVEPGVASDSPALREAAERARRQSEAEKIIQDDPFVQSMLEQFKSARIVPGSIKPSLQ